MKALPFLLLYCVMTFSLQEEQSDNTEQSRKLTRKRRSFSYGFGDGGYQQSMGIGQNCPRFCQQQATMYLRRCQMMCQQNQFRGVLPNYGQQQLYPRQTTLFRPRQTYGYVSPPTKDDISSCNCMLKSDPPGILPGWLRQKGCDKNCGCSKQKGEYCQFGFWRDVDLCYDEGGFKRTRTINAIKYSVCDRSGNNFCEKHAGGLDEKCFKVDLQELQSTTSSADMLGLRARENTFAFIKCCKGNKCAANEWNRIPWPQCENTNPYVGAYFCSDSSSTSKDRECLFGNDKECRNEWLKTNFGNCESLNADQIKILPLTTLNNRETCFRPPKPFVGFGVRNGCPPQFDNRDPCFRPRNPFGNPRFGFGIGSRFGVGNDCPPQFNNRDPCFRPRKPFGNARFGFGAVSRFGVGNGCPPEFGNGQGFSGGVGCAQPVEMPPLPSMNVQCPPHYYQNAPMQTDQCYMDECYYHGPQCPPPQQQFSYGGRGSFIGYPRQPPVYNNLGAVHTGGYNNQGAVSGSIQSGYYAK